MAMNIPKTDETISYEARNLLRKFYSEYSIETTPRLDKKIDSYNAILPKSTTVMIAAPNGTSPNEIIRTAKRLHHEEMEPVPHIIARSIPNISYLENLLDKLQTEAAVDHLLVIAGDIPNPVGPYHNSMELLISGVFEKRCIKIIGVSGHPEGTPYVGNKELIDAIRWKNEYATRTKSDMYICTQFVFEATPVISWEQNIRKKGNQLPVKVGVPGVATLQTLLRMAATSGIGQSVRFLTHKASSLKKITKFSTPEQLITALAVHCEQDPSSLIEGVHFFPFGGVEKTSQWVGTQLRTECWE